MQTTTLETVRDDFIATIRAIVPDHTQHRDAGWAPVDQLEDVPGNRLRAFFVLFSPPRVVPDDAPYGDGTPWESEVQVWTNYTDLPDGDVVPAIYRDARQLFIALQDRLDPQLSGLFEVRQDQEFQPENDQSGAVWGYHPFQARWLGEGE